MFNRREFSTTLALAAATGLVRPGAVFGSGRQATVFDWRPINEIRGSRDTRDLGVMIDRITLNRDSS